MYVCRLLVVLSFDFVIAEEISFGRQYDGKIFYFFLRLPTLCMC